MLGILDNVLEKFVQFFNSNCLSIGRCYKENELSLGHSPKKAHPTCSPLCCSISISCSVDESHVYGIEGARKNLCPTGADFVEHIFKLMRINDFREIEALRFGEQMV